MRWFVTAVAVVVLAGCACAQDSHLLSAPSTQVQSHAPRPRFDFSPAAQTPVTRRYWYWEVDDSIRVPFETYKYLPGGMMAMDQGFAPASLEWTFTGKHKFVPSLDLTVIQVKPGERSIAPKADSEFGTIVPGRGYLWTKATRSLMAALHY